MPLLKPLRSSQNVQGLEFSFWFSDTAKDSVDGRIKTFGANFADLLVFDAINMPRGAIIVSGSLIIGAPWVGPTVSTISVGTAASPNAFVGAPFDLKQAAGTFPLLPGGAYVALDGSNIRLTLAHTVANATQGIGVVRLLYIIEGRTENVVPH